MTEETSAGGAPHRRVTMSGRDPHEEHRTATALELLFDLTFVIAYSAAANELAHALAADHVWSGLVGFAFAVFAVTWAWINYAWFASAYDTDDWLFRLMTMVQMVGVLVLALGLPPVFASIEHGEYLDNRVMVLGYVVMRVPMLFQWIRAARQDPERRRSHLAYIVSITVSQVLWCGILITDMGIATTFAVMAVPLLIELSGPVLGERGAAEGTTPWHAHHIAERYSLLVIIALGEGLLGTAVALAAVVGPDGPGWSVDAAILGFAGTALIFGMWWIYFVLPHGEMLDRHRERSFGWGYGHYPLLGALVAVGAGLHVGAFQIEDKSDLGVTATVLAVAVPLSLYVLLLFGIYGLLARSVDPFHGALLLLAALPVAGALALAGAGVPVVWALAVLALTPWVIVLGYELRGHEHEQAVLDRD